MIFSPFLIKFTCWIKKKKRSSRVTKTQAFLVVYGGCLISWMLSHKSPFGPCKNECLIDFNISVIDVLVFLLFFNFFFLIANPSCFKRTISQLHFFFIFLGFFLWRARQSGNLPRVMQRRTFNQG